MCVNLQANVEASLPRLFWGLVASRTSSRCHDNCECDGVINYRAYLIRVR